MPATKLHAFKNRDEAHKKLEEVLAAGLHPGASCREDLNEPEPYQVWSNGPEAHVLPPEPAAMSEDDMLDRLAAKLLERMEKKAVK
jgi:hypothetical protein